MILNHMRHPNILKSPRKLDFVSEQKGDIICPLFKLEGCEMDSLDFKILKIMNGNARRSLKSIAEELGITGTAVAKRIEGMVSEGVVKSFEVTFDPALLRLNVCIANVYLKGRYITSEIISELERIQEIYFVTSSMNGTLTLMFYYESGEDLEMITEKIGMLKPVSRIETSIPRSHSIRDEFLSKLDWKLINSLNHDARKKNHKIAMELGVSTKTIKRRIDRLLKSGVVSFTVDVDLSKSKEHIIFLLVVDINTGVKKEKIREEIRKRYEDRIWSIEGPVHPSVVFFMYAETLSEIGYFVDDVKEITEVRDARAELYTDHYRFTKMLDERIKIEAEG